MALLTCPEELARLRADPSLLPAAVEELLRFTNPLNHATDRFTTQDMTVGEVVIPAGQTVFMAISSANRDQRFLGSGSFIWYRDIARLLRERLPGAAGKVRTRACHRMATCIKR